MPTDDRPVRRSSEVPSSLVERQIAEAMERGEFDDLPGAGEPIPGLDKPYDPSWWAQAWLRRERLVEEARELRRSALAEYRRLRAAGEGEEAGRRLADADRELGKLNRLLRPEDRVARLRDTAP
jgi:hypothetical protein